MLKNIAWNLVISIVRTLLWIVIKVKNIHQSNLQAAAYGYNWALRSKMSCLCRISMHFDRVPRLTIENLSAIATSGCSWNYCLAKRQAWKQSILNIAEFYLTKNESLNFLEDFRKKFPRQKILKITLSGEICWICMVMAACPFWLLVFWPFTGPWLIIWTCCWTWPSGWPWELTSICWFVGTIWNCCGTNWICWGIITHWVYVGGALLLPELLLI